MAIAIKDPRFIAMHEKANVFALRRDPVAFFTEVFAAVENGILTPIQVLASTGSSFSYLHPFFVALHDMKPPQTPSGRAYGPLLGPCRS